MLSNISLLVPAIASLVPALMAVMNAAGVVAGGALEWHRHLVLHMLVLVYLLVWQSVL